jgi:hypothetical protein
MRIEMIKLSIGVLALLKINHKVQIQQKLTIMKIIMLEK